MERSLKPLAVIFDIGGVLVPPEGGVAVLAASLDVDPETFAAAYWGNRDDYDRGGSAVDYWHKVTTSVGRSVDAERVRLLDKIDAERWSTLAPDVEPLVKDVAETDVRTALLSNAPTSMAQAVHTSDWSTYFPTRIFSCDLSVAKPEPGAYQAIEQALELDGRDLLFFDDRPSNVIAARQRGWRAHVWQGTADCRAVLAEVDVLATDHRV